MQTPITPAGGKVLACKLDEACPILDCDDELEDYAQVLLGAPEGADLLTHYCGLDYLGRLSAPDEEA